MNTSFVYCSMNYVRHMKSNKGPVTVTALLATMIVMVLAGCTRATTDKERNSTSGEWALVYKNDKDGEPVYGSKDTLISNVRKGYPIRIGWSSRRRNDTSRSVEHLVDAEILTIANGNEVFAQIKPFFAQRPDLTSDTLSMTLMPVEMQWVLGTNGLLSSVRIDHGTDSVSAAPPGPFGYALSWFSQRSGSPTH